MANFDYIEGDTGKGKTLTAVYYAVIYQLLYPTHEIFANFHLFGFKNFTYSKYCFLPYSRIKNALVIIDDIRNLSNKMKGLFSQVSCSSRKASLFTIATCQYYTHIPLELRKLANSMIVANWTKSTDILEFAVIKQNGNVQIETVNRAVKNYGMLYDTNEIVARITPKQVREELIKISESLQDLDENISIYTESETKHIKLYKELKPLLEIKLGL